MKTRDFFHENLCNLGQFGYGLITISQFGIGVVSISHFAVGGFALAQFGIAYSLIAQFGLYIQEGRGQFVKSIAGLLGMFFQGTPLK